MDEAESIGKMVRRVNEAAPNNPEILEFPVYGDPINPVRVVGIKMPTDLVAREMDEYLIKCAMQLRNLAQAIITRYGSEDIVARLVGRDKS